MPEKAAIRPEIVNLKFTRADRSAHLRVERADLKRKSADLWLKGVI